MIAKISEVTRVYRTNEIWREEDQAWQQGGWQERPFVSSKETTDVVFQRYAFGKHARVAAKALAGVLTTAGDLKQAGEALLNSDSSLDKRTVESSSSGALTGTADKGASIRNYTIEAKQMAKSQKNEGIVLDSTAPTLMAAGSNQMKLTMNDKTISFSVYILPTDTNQQALQKIRGAIHYTKSDIHTSLVLDDSNKTIQLQLISMETGTEQAFSITDIYGNAAAVSGINHVVQHAEDAIYHINGNPAVNSASNEISLDEGNVSLTLQEASQVPIEIAIRPDTMGIKRQVQALVDRYNSLHLMLTQSGGLLSSEASEAVMGKLFSLPLEDIGINLNADGSLSVDTFVLEQQAQLNFGLLEYSLRGFGGLAAALNVAASKLLDPPSYELLDPNQALFQSFSNYQFSEWDGNPINTYLPVPLSGILMNDYI
jgi:flagellar hook-associated protein 2